MNKALIDDMAEVWEASVIRREIETSGYAQTYNKDMAEYCRENGYRVEDHDGKYCIWNKR